MLSVIKRFLICLILLTIIGVVFMVQYSNNHTFTNQDSVTGNTTGNLYNGGLFCERNGKIYFSNDADDGTLYVMNSDCTNFKKITDDKAVYINADDNYIYYVKANDTRENKSGSFFYFKNNGVYRINQNGTHLKAITGKPGAYLTLKGNFLYFQNYDVNKGLYLFRYQTDGSKERVMVKDAVIPAAVTDQLLYFTGNTRDHQIHQVDLSSYTIKTVFPGSYLQPIIFGDYVYYINLEDKYRIYRMNLDGSDPTPIVKERCSSYNITNSGMYLYYQVDNQKKNRMARINLETMSEETLIMGDFKQIHVTDKYVFFKDYNNKNTYILTADGTGKLNTFHPPIEGNES